ncbi:MAG TPA: MmgE/PrpD family protein [Burkholderiales bacterium]|nr:MmgE/PrpD family protein [Burkholderiales bacterium]
MTHVIQSLADFALGLSFDKLPASTVTAAKRVILDTLGCAIGAVGCEPARIAAALATPAVEGPDSGVATIIGSGEHASLKRAILVNGILNRYLDYGDVYWKRDVPHPSEVVTVALACAEVAGLSGRAFIETMLAGYEAQLRMCDAFAFQVLGMHAASAGGFVAPLMIGRARGMDASAIAHAVALNGARHLIFSGLAKGELSMAKAIAFPLSAVEAVGACDLAAKGFTGPVGILDWLFEARPQVLEDATRPEIDVAFERYRVEQVTLKRFPVQFEIQSGVEAAVALAARLPGPALESIEDVTVTTRPITRERTADPKKYRPSNRETADHSMPCAVAMALADGRLGAEQFEADRWAAPDVATLMGRIKVVGDDALEASYPNGRPARVVVRLKDGRELTEFVPVPLGDARRPMSQDDVRRKFSELAAHCMSAERIDAIVATVERLEHLPRVSELTALLSSSKK